MNRNTLQGSWKQIKGNVKNKWGKLTDDDLEQASGNFDVLVGSLQKRYGLERQAAEKQLDEFISAIDTRSMENKSQGTASVGDDQNLNKPQMPTAGRDERFNRSQNNPVSGDKSLSNKERHV